MSQNIVKILLLLSFVATCTHTSQERTSLKSKSPNLANRPSCSFEGLDPQSRYFQIISADQSKLDPSSTVVILNEARNFFDIQTNSRELSLDEAGCFQVGEPWAKVHIMDQQKHQARNLDLSTFSPGVVHKVRLEIFPAQEEPAQYLACGNLKEINKITPGMIFDLFDAEGKEIAAHQMAAVLIGKDGTRRLPISEGGCILLSANDHGTILYSDQKSFVLEFIYRGPNSSGDPYLRMLGSPAKKTVKEFTGILHKG